MPSKEKIEKYQDLKREMTRLWNTTTYVVPVVEVLGMIPKNLKQHLEATSCHRRRCYLEREDY